MLGTPEYVAPEIIRSEGYGESVDWWAMGILIYEFLVGWPPWVDDNPLALFKKITKARIGWPRDMSPAARRCIREFLQVAVCTYPLRSVTDLPRAAHPRVCSRLPPVTIRYDLLLTCRLRRRRIRVLLQPDRSKRLGNINGGVLVIQVAEP